MIDVAERDMFADIYGASGFSMAVILDPGELAFLRDSISAQWLDRIAAAHPDKVEAFRTGGIAQYHRSAHLVSHESLWTKEHRVLPRASVSHLTQLGFVKRLLREFGAGSRVADIVLLSGGAPQYPEVYWRLVRPNVASDVGPMHCDSWFHQILAGGKNLYSEDETTIKLWLAVHSEPGLNGLYMVPRSHRRKWRMTHVAGSDGYHRPALDEPLGDFEKVLIPAAPGQGILFSEDFLHGGAVNRGNTCRVSIEMTFVLKRAELNR